jgi:hypothetical protein
VSGKPRKAFDGIARPKGIIDDIVGPLAKAASKKAMSPKVEQQVARSMTKRRAMAKTEKMAKNYYGKK